MKQEDPLPIERVISQTSKTAEVTLFIHRELVTRHAVLESKRWFVKENNHPTTEIYEVAL